MFLSSQRLISLPTIGLPLLTPVFSLIIILVGASIWVPPVFADSDAHLLKYHGPITPVASEFILQNIEDATDANAGILILQLDTPGGLDQDMRVIVKAMLRAKIPVIVFVGPAGSRAASAGAFITVAAHVAAMAPGTNIGSASPVQMMGAGMDSTMTHKVTNDAAAYIASIAKDKNRNPELVRRFVEQALNITSEEAHAQGVIEILAPTVAALLDSLDGQQVMVDGIETTLATAEATLVACPMSTRLKFLKRLVDPNVAYLLFMLGVYGLFFELSNPGSIIPGILGSISILLALYAFHALPVNYTGVGLILLGVILLILEVKVHSFGALTIGGITSLVLGSMMLFNSPEQWARVSMLVLVPAVAVFAGFFLLCITLVVRGLNRPGVTGPEAMIGETGRVLEKIGGEDEPGKVVIHGEIWDALANVSIATEAQIKVLEVKGRVVRVMEIREAIPKQQSTTVNNGG